MPKQFLFHIRLYTIRKLGHIFRWRNNNRFSFMEKNYRFFFISPPSWVRTNGRRQLSVYDSRTLIFDLCKEKPGKTSFSAKIIGSW